MTGEQKPGGLEVVAWPVVTDQWAETYCELTGRDPDGQHVTFVDGGTVTTFRDMARREIEAMLCAAPKSAVRTIATAEPAEARIGDLERQLRIVQNAAKTLHHCRDTELQHLRENATFDHRLRAEHESLMERDAMMTDLLEQAEARATAAEAKLARAVKAFERIRDGADPKYTARQTLAALQQEGE